MYRYQLGIPLSEYDGFVKEHPMVNLLQSSAWEKVKSDWNHERLGVYEGENLLAVASILTSSNLSVTFCYCIETQTETKVA